MKKLLILMLAILLVMPMTMALDFKFDNVKTFEKGELEHGKAIIWDTDLLSKDDKLMEIVLTDNSDYCNINCYAEGTIVLYEKNKLVDSLRFLNTKENDYQDIGYNFYLKENGKWVEYNGQELKGEYEWRLEGRKKTYESIDWLATFFGFEITEWDLWDSRNILYYNFEDSTELVSGTYNLVNNEGVPTYQTEKALIGKSGLAEVNVNWNIPYNDMINWTLGNKSINFWVRPYLPTANTYMLGARYDTEAFYLGTSGAETDRFRFSNLIGGDPFYSPRGVFVNNTWVMITLARNDTDFIYWINGTHKNITATPPDLHGAGFDMKIGAFWSDGNEFIGLYDEMGFWNETLTDTDVTELFNNYEGTTKPSTIVTLNLPANNTKTSTSEVNFSSNFTEGIGSELIWQNSTYNVWYSNGSLFNQTIIDIGVSNFTSLNISGFIVGNYKWNVYGCSQNNTNPGMRCGWAEFNYTFTMGSSLNTLTYNTTTYETSRENVILNITPFGGATPTNGLFNYNGTSTTATITASDNNYLLQSNYDIPLISDNVNKTFNFTWDINGVTDSSNNTNQTIFPISFNYCNATLATRFLNISFQDEADLSRLNASIPLSTFTYYLGSGEISETLEFINNTDAFEWNFCADPQRPFNVLPTLQYKKGLTHPQRIWNPAVTQYTNLTTNQTLYLLNAIDGIYVTFQTVNSAEQPLSGVDITAVRSIAGMDFEVGTGTTTSSGSQTFFLNPDFVHDFTFEKTGFTTFVDSFAPTQTSYTIFMGGTTSEGTDYSKGISYSIKPSVTQLINDTTFSFNLTLDSSFWDISQFGITLKLSNGTVLQSTTANTNGGTLNLNQDTDSYDSIVMDYFWIINSTQINASRYWTVYNTANTQWSISRFFTDLTLYLDSGIFGLDDFGRHLIVYLVIFISVGIMSFRFGLASPMSISTLVFGIIYFFDVVIGLMPNPIDAITNFPTLVAALILVVVIFREVQR